MYSKVKIAGHPIYPMLIAYPVAFCRLAFYSIRYKSKKDRPVSHDLQCPGLSLLFNCSLARISQTQ